MRQRDAENKLAFPILVRKPGSEWLVELVWMGHVCGMFHSTDERAALEYQNQACNILARWLIRRDEGLIATLRKAHARLLDTGADEQDWLLREIRGFLEEKREMEGAYPTVDLQEDGRK